MKLNDNLSSARAISESEWAAIVEKAWRGGAEAGRMEVERIVAKRVAALVGPAEALAAKWADVLAECKEVDPHWILDRSVTTLETALSELRAALEGR